MLLNVFYRIADRANVLVILVLDLKVEFLLHRHDDLNEIKRICVQIADELRAFNDLIGIDAESLDGDRLYSLECCCQIRTLLQNCGSGPPQWAPVEPVSPADQLGRSCNPSTTQNMARHIVRLYAISTPEPGTPEG